MFTATVVVAALLAALFLATGIPKITQAKRTLEMADHLHVARPLYRVVGALEAAGALGGLVGLWLGWLGVAAGGGLTLLMLGALGSHLRVKDPAKAMAPAVVATLLAAGYVVLRIATL